VYRLNIILERRVKKNSHIIAPNTKLNKPTR